MEVLPTPQLDPGLHLNPTYELMGLDDFVAPETTYFPIARRASDSPFRLTYEYHAKDLSTPHMDICIASHLTSNGFAYMVVFSILLLRRD